MSEGEAQSRRWDGAGRKALALLLGLIVAFGCAEVVLRLTQPLVDLDVMTGRAPGPNPMSRWAQVDAFCGYRARPDDTGRYGKTVNRDGFISTPELAVTKEPGVLRVAFLGGSSTAGTGHRLTDEQTWPWRTADLLREKFPERRIEFLNGALGGFTTFESYGRLWSRIRFYSPDVVLVNHAWNEMYYFSRADDIHRHRVLRDGGWNFDSPDVRMEFAPSSLDPFLGWSCLLTHIRRWTATKHGEIGGGARALAADFDPRGPEVFRENLRFLLAFEDVLGPKVFVAKQPTLIVPGLAKELRDRCGYGLHGFDHDAHVRAFDAIYRVIDEEVPAERIVDLTSLSGDPEIFKDHIHPTPRGARRIAGLVAERLAPDLP